ncbi:hypothetical protein DOT_2351 [Desulfosporosinus sp. OT]|nr:hypothetical protein DOT_2351 [Desulfosporosinus sp. OT]
MIGCGFFVFTRRTLCKEGINMEKRVHPDLRKMFSVIPAQ